MRPRQARYQAALRPDMKCSIHSKALSDFLLVPTAGFLALTVPLPCIYSPNCLLDHDRAHSFRRVCGAISPARRLSFSRASRFICNFI